MNDHIATDELTRFEDQAGKILATAEALKITSNDEYEYAAANLIVIKSKYKELQESRLTLTRPLDESKKRIMDLFAKPLSMLENAERVIKQATEMWRAQQEIKRLAEEARLREEARKERERLEAEARKKQEEADTLRREALENLARGNAAVAEKMERRAERLETKAEERLNESSLVVEPILAPTVSKVKGISYREEWDFIIEKPELLPREYTIPNEKAIRGVVKSLKGQTNIPGVRVFSKESTITRTR